MFFFFLLLVGCIWSIIFQVERVESYGSNSMPLFEEVEPIVIQDHLCQTKRAKPEHD